LRRIIQELPYEQPLAAGRFAYTQDGKPTGAMETWQLTQAPEGYRFLRVDLDAGASSGDNVLYHLIVDEMGRPDRLKFHFFRQDMHLRGDLLFAAETALLTRDVNGEMQETEASFPEQTSFWFPSSAGLSLLGQARSGAALTLNRAKAFDLWPTSATLNEGPAETVTLMGQDVATRRVTLRWEDEHRVMWLDTHDWPVRVQRGPLLSTETRYVRYSWTKKERE
jgi:hypothetical protein